MPDDRNDSKFSRRGFLEASSGALAAAGANSVAKLLGPDQVDPQGSGRSKSDPAPRTSRSTPKTPLPQILHQPMQAACRHSNTRSRSDISGCTTEGGRAK